MAPGDKRVFLCVTVAQISLTILLPQPLLTGYFVLYTLETVVWAVCGPLRLTTMSCSRWASHFPPPCWTKFDIIADHDHESMFKRIKLHLNLIRYKQAVEQEYLIRWPDSTQKTASKLVTLGKQQNEQIIRTCFFFLSWCIKNWLLLPWCNIWSTK